MNLDLTQIGTVRSDFETPVGPDEMRDHESEIIIEEGLTEGLYRIEDSDYLNVLFYLHESGEYTLRGPRRHGTELGLFACRSPNRPSPIGLTTVELLERDGNVLKVDGLDAIDGTPILDIKPFVPSLDTPDRREHPRRQIETAISKGDVESVLLRAGESHGHFCPYLALGVRAGVHAMGELSARSTGMEDIVAVVETNSCFSDGVQVSTGCTFGNNALIYRDYGKTAMTLVSRDHPDRGIRVHVKERENFIERDYPEASDLFDTVVAEREGSDEQKERLSEAWAEVGFDLVDRPIEELFDIETGVSVDLPDQAPIFEDAMCVECGEQMMAPKAVERDGQTYCRACAEVPVSQLDGRGIVHGDER